MKRFKKIIFLDIDGVLCFDFNDYDFKHRHCHLDFNAVQLLNGLIAETGAKLVISSVWRKRGTITLLQNILSREGVVGRVVGKTNVLGTIRGEEIKAWLDSNRVENYVILDDDSDMLKSQIDHFVHIRSENGLQIEHMRRAIDILNS